MTSGDGIDVEGMAERGVAVLDPPVNPALNKLKIFFSHKAKDTTIAQNIKDELEFAGAGRLEIFLSQSINFGEDWLSTIKEELHSSDWLIPLYTDPSDNWEWCLYESGYFDGKKDEGPDNNRLICLHSEHVIPPAALNCYQNVKTTKEKIEKLLKEIYGKPPRVGVSEINPPLAENPERLSELSNEIINSINVIDPRSEKETLSDYIFINLKQSELKELEKNNTVPDTSLIESNAKSMALFGLTKKSCTWEKLTAKLKENNPNLLFSLNEAISIANKGDTVESSLPTFRPNNQKTPYRPVLYQIDKMPDRSRRFKVIFTPIYDYDYSNPGFNLGKIVTLLKMCRMFRWGVITKFINKLNALEKCNPEEAETKVEIANSLRKLWNEVLKVENSACLEGFEGEDSIIRLFETQERRDKIKTQFRAWNELRKALMDATTIKDDAMDIETMKEKATNALDALEKCKELNKDFMVMAAKKICRRTGKNGLKRYGDCLFLMQEIKPWPDLSVLS